MWGNKLASLAERRAGQSATVNGNIKLTRPC